MTTLEKYNQIRAQIRELEKQAEELKELLKQENTQPFKASGGVYGKHSNGTYEVCYWNYQDKTIFTKEPIYDEKHHIIGRDYGIRNTRNRIVELQQMGFTLI